MNRKLLLLVVPVLVLVLTACAGDDGGEENGIAEEPPSAEEATPTQEPEPTQPPEPDPTFTPPPDDSATEDEDDALARDDDPGEDGDPFDEDSIFDDDALGEADDPFGTVPDVHMEDFHDQALSELLLGAEQLPDGWVVIGEGSFPDDAEATHSLADMMAAPCDNEVLTPEAMGNPVHVGRNFIGEGLGPFFNQDLYEFEDEHQAAEAMEMTVVQLDCDDWTAEDPTTGMDVKYTIEDLDFPELGDETVAVTLKIDVSSEDQAGVQTVQFDDPFGGLSSEMILVRQGHVLSSFTYMDWFGDGTLYLEETVTLAVEQVENAQ